jgi:hypothetical protein
MPQSIGFYTKNMWPCCRHVEVSTLKVCLLNKVKFKKTLFIDIAVLMPVGGSIGFF